MPLSAVLLALSAVAFVAAAEWAVWTAPNITTSGALALTGLVLAAASGVCWGVSVICLMIEAE